MTRLLAVPAAVTTLALAACGGSHPSGGTHSTSGSHPPYPASVQTNFVKSCKAQFSTSTNYCECVFKHIEATVPLAQFQAGQLAAKTGAGPPNYYLKATEACVGQ
jgi:hypothetical protein